MEKSLLIIKPGFVQHRDGILEMLTNIGVSVIREQKMVLDDELIAKHYADYVNEDWFQGLKDYMQSDEVIVLAVQGEDGIIPKIRELLGDKRNPAPGTIRYVYGIGEVTRNVMHASDAVAAGIREIRNFFPDLV